MAIEPRQNYVNSHESNERVKPVLEEYALFLRSHVGIGSRVSHWLDDYDDKTTRTALKLLINRQLETIDACELLVKSGASEPCRVFLRTLTELTIFLLYISDNNSRDRSTAYILSLDVQSLLWHQKLDSSTAEGKEFHRIVRNDALFKASKFPARDSKLFRTQLEHAIIDAGQSAVWNSWKENLKRSWYSIDSNCNSVSALASWLGVPYLYESFYRSYSEYMHGNVRNNYDDEARSYGIRSPHNAPLITSAIHELWKIGTVAAVANLLPSKKQYLLDLISTHLAHSATIIQRDKVHVSWSAD